MNPYLQAHELHEKHNHAGEWTAALDFHLQHGMVLRTPGMFVMFRPVLVGHEDEFDQFHVFEADWRDCYIWAAAGNLREMIEAGIRLGIERVHFHRHTDRLHSSPLARLVAHLFNR